MQTHRYTANAERKEVNALHFDYYYLGRLADGQSIAVKVNQQAYVILTDTANLRAYLHRRAYRQYGRLQNNREERYRIPYPGEWHIIVAVTPPANPVRSEIRFPRAAT